MHVTESQKFTAATKTAFIAAFTAWAKNIFTPLFNTLTESWVLDFFDANGTFIGGYEILKEMRVTKNADGTGGSYGTDARRSSIVEPSF
ncbi:hypothetical protein [Paenibacillus mucilaginosus]|uniref:hypothetical protein n=1 Tax=Paenibacillus mucilaginosus TaxID=61624 RepID=UPI003D1F18BC